MGPKLFFSILFGFPTILLVYIYYDLGINNIWQLSLFIWVAILGYMPGIIMANMFLRNKVQKTLIDFVDYGTNVNR